jgi:hypothetical protein
MGVLLLGFKVYRGVDLFFGWVFGQYFQFSCSLMQVWLSVIFLIRWFRRQSQFMWLRRNSRIVNGIIRSDSLRRKPQINYSLLNLLSGGGKSKSKEKSLADEFC